VDFDLLFFFKDNKEWLKNNLKKPHPPAPLLLRGELIVRKTPLSAAERLKFCKLL
jgi:hypothetical protein